MVAINRGRVSLRRGPLRRRRPSGFGHSGGAEGIDEYLDTRYLSVSRGRDPVARTHACANMPPGRRPQARRAPASPASDRDRGARPGCRRSRSGPREDLVAALMRRSSKPAAAMCHRVAARRGRRRRWRSGCRRRRGSPRRRRVLRGQQEAAPVGADPRRGRRAQGGATSRRAATGSGTCSINACEKAASRQPSGDREPGGVGDDRVHGQPLALGARAGEARPVTRRRRSRSARPGATAAARPAGARAAAQVEQVRPRRRWKDRDRVGLGGAALHEREAPPPSRGCTGPRSRLHAERGEAVARPSSSAPPRRPARARRRRPARSGRASR